MSEQKTMCRPILNCFAFYLLSTDENGEHQKKISEHVQNKKTIYLVILRQSAVTSDLMDERKLVRTGLDRGLDINEMQKMQHLPFN
jgi:hypothetical protein